MYLLICLLIIFALIICILSVSRRKDKKMIKSLQQLNYLIAINIVKSKYDT